MFLLRHAITGLHADGLKFGHTDAPLNDEGRATAAEYLPPIDVLMVYTSPLARAAETAAIITHRHTLPAPIVLPWLIERDHGAAEGMTVEDRTARWPTKDRIPGRESDPSVTARVAPLLALIPSRSLIVTHAGVIYALTGHKAAHLETVEWTP